MRVADDLVKRDFQPPVPNRLWVADLTYLRTWQGWPYLGVVVDCDADQCAGSSITQTKARSTSRSLSARCRLAGIEQSMGGRGSAYDNAVCESFFKTLKAI